MTPEFATVVDPVFEYTLELLDRLEQGGDLDVAQEQQNITHMLSHAESKLARNQDRRWQSEWELAQFAIVCWIDSMITETALTLDEQKRQQWIGHPLQLQLFQTVEGGVEFFSRAKKASSEHAIDALEVYYLCVILGFRGFYDQPELVESFAKQYKLFSSLQEWKNWAAESIRSNTAPELVNSGRICRGAEPLNGEQWLPGSVLLFGITFIVAAIMAFSWVII